jgi:hypothetical protein
MPSLWPKESRNLPSRVIAWRRKESRASFSPAQFVLPRRKAFERQEGLVV